MSSRNVVFVIFACLAGLGSGCDGCTKTTVPVSEEAAAPLVATKDFLRRDEGRGRLLAHRHRRLRASVAARAETRQARKDHEHDVAGAHAQLILTASTAGEDASLRCEP